MKKFNKITIIGTGLIGGSLGLVIKRKKLARQVFGIAKHEKTIEEAVKLGAIDKGSLKLKDAQESELIIICTPVGEVVSTVQKIIPFLRAGSLITDVGSTKKKITQEIERILPREIHFVGGHPLAGSEKKGVRAARRDLFANSLTFLIKSKKTDIAALKKVKQLWEEVGSRAKITSAAQHDKIVAEISHLPHIAAVSLVNSVSERYLKYAAKGWKDSTRIALSDASLRRDICIDNKEEISRALEAFIEHLIIMRDLIQKGDSQEITKEFKKARQKKLKEERIVIAIDGPAGAGKSAVSQKLAAKLGFYYLDTGAMYRAITLKAIKEGIDLRDKARLIKMCQETEINFRFKKAKKPVLLLDGKDVEREIRKEEITNKVFYLAKLPEIRKRMVILQRKISEGKDIVAEGRDIGSVVFPQAKKFYLDASIEERTKRRYKQLLTQPGALQGEKLSLEKIEQNIKIRDKKDSERKVAPLKRVKDAIYIDTTEMSIQQVVKRILECLMTN